LFAPVGTGTDTIWFFAIADWKLAVPVQFLNVWQPAPDNGTCCGLLLSLSAMDRLALAFPRAVGVNVIETSHDFPDATLVAWFPLQSEVIAKGPGLGETD
jgi:hypothetical protein